MFGLQPYHLPTLASIVCMTHTILLCGGGGLSKYSYTMSWSVDSTAGILRCKFIANQIDSRV
jgi:hypothetical protein